MSTIHIPVMLSEVIDGLKLKRGDTVVDATLGGGGHALAIWERIGGSGRLVAFDADSAAIERFRLRLMRESTLKEAFESGHIILLCRPFSDIGEALREHGIVSVSAVVADLGLSSDQLEDPSRGFSLFQEGPLDMRFDVTAGETAARMVNDYDEREIARILKDFGDVSDASVLARAIVERRKEHRFETTTDLAEYVKRHSRHRHASIHPATKVFQALRIAVNHEEEFLEKFLRDSVGILKTGGRIAVLSFHSGEERVVKRVFRDDARGCVCPKEFPVCRCGRKARLRVITKRALVPSEEEIVRNPRARSAKLRISERI